MLANNETGVVQPVAEAAAIVHAGAPLESGLKAISPHAVNFGEAAGRLPNTTLFAVEGMKAETAVIGFDLEGIAVSSGAACSSGKVQSSHVLAATEICARARRGAREPGLEHREADIERFLAAWRRLASALSRGRHLNGCIGERFTTVRTVKRPTWVTGRGQIRARTHVHHARWIFWRRPLVKAREFFT